MTVAWIFTWLMFAGLLMLAWSWGGAPFGGSGSNTGAPAPTATDLFNCKFDGTVSLCIHINRFC